MVARGGDGLALWSYGCRGAHGGTFVFWYGLGKATSISCSGGITRPGTKMIVCQYSKVWEQAMQNATIDNLKFHSNIETSKLFSDHVV
jgi:hypothetical protein